SDSGAAARRRRGAGSGGGGVCRNDAGNGGCAVGHRPAERRVRRRHCADGSGRQCALAVVAARGRTMTSIRIKKRVSAAFALEADFSLGPGITALIGPAGAGKTLLLEIVAGLATPDEGRILLNDAILFDGQARVDLAPVRRGCGYVSQTDSLFPHRNLRQNLEFAARRFPRLER